MNEADPRVRRTRKLLQEAFMALLAEKGFQAISVQDIAERATLNRATFYAHFEDKYALMDYLLEESFREALQRHLAPDAPFTRSNLYLLVVTVCEFLEQLHGHCAPASQELLDSRFEAKLQQELSTVLMRWLGQSQTAQVRPEVAAAVLSWAIFGAGVTWSSSARKVTASEWARQVMTLLVGGMAMLG